MVVKKGLKKCSGIWFSGLLTVLGQILHKGQFFICFQKINFFSIKKNLNIHKHTYHYNYEDLFRPIL